MSPNRRHKPLLACALALSMPLLCAHVFAQTAQQTKMKTCNADATTQSLKGADRKAFMKTCLSAAPAAPAATNSQQEKMKSCNADAKTKALKGDERKKFMSSCLKGA
jgi:hypothetical protein